MGLESVVNSKCFRVLVLAPVLSAALSCAAPGRHYHPEDAWDKKARLEYQNPGSGGVLDSLPHDGARSALSDQEQRLWQEKHTRYLVGLCQLNNGEYSSAIRNLNSLLAMEQDPDSNRLIQASLVDALVGLGTEESLFRALYITNNLDFRPHFGLGVMYLEQGELDKASRFLENSLRLNPFNYSALKNLRSIREINKDWENALFLSEMARQMESMANPYEFRQCHYDSRAGWYLVELGRYESAIQVLEGALAQEDCLTPEEADLVETDLFTAYRNHSAAQIVSEDCMGFAKNYSIISERFGFEAANGSIDYYARRFSDDPVRLNLAMAGICYAFGELPPRTENYFLVGRACLVAGNYHQAKTCFEHVQSNICDMMPFDISIDIVESYIDLADDGIEQLEIMDGKNKTKK